MIEKFLEFINNFRLSELYTPLQNKILVNASLLVYLIFIPLELIVSNYQHRKVYTWQETLVNIYLNLVNAAIDGAFRLVALGILFFVYRHKIVTISNAYLYWFLLFILQDFAFYLEHRLDHSCRFFWAVHVTHHSSEEYNLSIGFRSSVLMPFYRFLYFMPLAFLGFEPLHIAFMYALTQIYGILVHTQYIKTMPKWFEFLFVSPSHHRVHHASNVIYLDKNMGMCLIIWDKLLGTFQAELSTEPIRYGLVTKNEKPYHPIKVIFHEWIKLYKDATQKNLNFKQRLNYIFNAPGWSHNGSTLTAKEMRKNLRK